MGQTILNLFYNLILYIFTYLVYFFQQVNFHSYIISQNLTIIDLFPKIHEILIMHKILQIKILAKIDLLLIFLPKVRIIPVFQKKESQNRCPTQERSSDFFSFTQSKFFLHFRTSYSVPALQVHLRLRYTSLLDQ